MPLIFNTWRRRATTLVSRWGQHPFVLNTRIFFNWLRRKPYRYSGNKPKVFTPEFCALEGCRIVATLEKPLLMVIDHFLSDAECDALIALASANLQRSQVVAAGASVQSSKVSKIRTSEEANLSALVNHPLLKTIDNRIRRAVAASSLIQSDEMLSVLRYQPGQEYQRHVDYFPQEYPVMNRDIENRGNRVASMLIYLNDVAGGGETSFPQVGFSVQARKGSAVYFEYGNEWGELDPRSLHCGCPVTQGEKWLAVKWFRGTPGKHRGAIGL